jgi:ABC-type multidrug transport system fused ATPase/permease subunit
LVRTWFVALTTTASVLHKDIGYFDATSTGELISSISSDVQEVRLAIRHAVTMGVRSVTQIVGGAVTLYFISSKLTNLMLVVLPSLVIVCISYATIDSHRQAL